MTIFRAPPSTPTQLTVVYDGDCPLCVRCRHWLELQPTYVPLRFLAAQSEAARRAYGKLPWLGAELVVASESGEAWIGPSAFLVALWATRKYRPWSYRLSGRALAPMAERFFHVISTNRSRLGAMIGSEACPDGRCVHRGSAQTDARPASCTQPW